jgi:DNA repair protein RecO (recombination protein O)
MVELLNGVLFRRTRFSNTSLILTWFTDLHGKTKAIAKGALRSGSPFAGKLDLFFHCELLLAFSRRSEIHQLREVSIKTTFSGIRASYLKTSAAAYFVELIESVTEPEHPVPEIYQLLLRAFGYLHRRNPDAKAVLFFESELCKCLGLFTPGVRGAAERIKEAYGRLPEARAALMSQF